MTRKMNLMLCMENRRLLTFEKIDRTDTKVYLCQACDCEGDLLSCESCTCAYHPRYLFPPLKAHFPSSCRWPECILDCEMRPTAASDSDASKAGFKANICEAVSCEVERIILPSLYMGTWGRFCKSFQGTSLFEIQT